MLDYRQVRLLFANAGFAPLHPERKGDIILSDHNLLLELRGVFQGSECIQQKIDDGCSLRVTNEWERKWLGDRLIFRPALPRFTRYVACFSSRFGTKLDQHDMWFAALRTLILGTATREETMITCQQTSCGSYCRRAAQLFGKDCLDVFISDKENATEWLTRVLHDDSPDSILVSPVIERSEARKSEIDEIPIADRTLVALANRFIGLHLRKNGNVHRLFRLLCSDHSVTASNLQLVACNELIPTEIFHELTAKGAVGRFLWKQPLESAAPKCDVSVDNRKADIIPMPPKSEWPYLSHWTRRAKAEWPDQDRTDFLDELILGCESKDRSSFAALVRILQCEIILATKGSNRNGTETVCFTQVPLHDWTRHRTFRHHRTRWDFEPYGVCVSQQWLKNKGARPVIYGSSGLRRSLNEVDLPFFQLQESKSAIDWTVEQEWRIIGDIQLNQIPSDQAIVFVATRIEAEHLASISPFPIVVLEEFFG